MLRPLLHPRAVARGFTLVELMVAMALGLIVVIAVLAFIFSLIRANSETVLDTRLNQELRATMAVIGGEIQRARAIKDPIAAVGRKGAIDYNNDGVVDATDTDFPNIILENVTVDGTVWSNACVRYAYYDGAAIVYRSIYPAGGRILMASASTRAGAACAGGTSINAPHGLKVTALRFAYDPLVTGKRRFSIHLTGQLADPPAYMTGNPAMAIRPKTIRQVVSIRSNDA
jgi:prepilin-type N-terminal cleavage/methylation domain-containing protein